MYQATGEMEAARRAGRELRFILIEANMILIMTFKIIIIAINLIIITFTTIIVIIMLRFPKEKRDILTLAAAQSENRTRARH